MEEKQKNNAFFSLMQYVILGVLSLVLFHLYDPQAIQESTMPLDCFLCNWLSSLIRLQLSLCSNSVFLILLCNVIICSLLVSSGLLTSPTEAPDFCKPCGIEGENLRVQIATEPCWIEKKYSVYQHERQDEVDYICNESIRIDEIYLSENFEEESKCDEAGAVVSYQSTQEDNKEEELERRCDEFIANFRRQMSVQRGYS